MLIDVLLAPIHHRALLTDGALDAGVVDALVRRIASR